MNLHKHGKCARKASPPPYSARSSVVKPLPASCHHCAAAEWASTQQRRNVGSPQGGSARSKLVAITLEAAVEHEGLPHLPHLQARASRQAGDTLGDMTCSWRRTVRLKKDRLQCWHRGTLACLLEESAQCVSRRPAQAKDTRPAFQCLSLGTTGSEGMRIACRGRLQLRQSRHHGKTRVQRVTLVASCSCGAPCAPFHRCAGVALPTRPAYTPATGVHYTIFEYVLFTWTA